MAGGAPKFVRFRVIPGEDGLMLRQLLQRRLKQEHRPRAEEIVKAGGVYVNQLRIRVPTVRVVPGERVTVYPSAPDVEPYEPEQLRFVHRDPSFVILDKPPGVPVQATRDSCLGTLSDALVRRLEGEGLRRPYVGVVHRLDRRASGLVLMTIRDVANKSLHRQFVEHAIEREYRLLVEPSSGAEVPPELEVRAPLHAPRQGSVRVDADRGKPAATRFERLAGAGSRHLLIARLETGRTHQVRVHAAHAGFPIVGDFRYGAAGGDEEAAERAPLHLHSHVLAFDHPLTGEPVRATAPLPLWAKVETYDDE